MGRILLNDIYKTTRCLDSGEIHKYLHGRTTTEGKRRVEEHLLDCPLCSDAIEGFEAASANIALPEDYSSFRKKLPGAGEGQVRRLRPGSILLRVAAAATILLASYFAFFQHTTPKHLFEQYYTSYRLDIPIDRRSVDETSSLNASLQNALEQYAGGQYAASVLPFEEALKAEPGNEAAHFFAGMACLETGQYEEAINFLSPVEKGGGIYAGKAAWYLSLAFLQTGDTPSAKKLLKEISSRDGYKKAEATALLSDL